jgi:hypothetical protein
MYIYSHNRVIEMRALPCGVCGRGGASPTVEYRPSNANPSLLINARVEVVKFSQDPLPADSLTGFSRLSTFALLALKMRPPLQN